MKRAKRRIFDREFTPAENRRRAKAKANYKSMAAKPFGDTTMPIPNPTIPQAQWFFVYLLWKDDDPGQLQTHVVLGFDERSLEETRRLVQSGAQIPQLLYLGSVCALEPHHRRNVKKLLSEVPNETTLFPEGVRVEESR